MSKATLRVIPGGSVPRNRGYLIGMGNKKVEVRHALRLAYATSRAGAVTDVVQMLSLHPFAWQVVRMEARS